MPLTGSSTRILRIEKTFLSESSHAFFITAPSMATPNVTYFHSATSSLRAMATMVVFFPRPPSTRALNHNERAEVGWFLSHSHASSISVVRSRGFPALETPCS